MSTEQNQVFQSGSWTFKEVKRGLYKAFLNDKSLAMTGSAVEVDIRIPFFHTIVRIELTQNDVNDAVSTLAFDFIFSTPPPLKREE